MHVASAQSTFSQAISLSFVENVAIYLSQSSVHLPGADSLCPEIVKGEKTGRVTLRTVRTPRPLAYWVSSAHVQ